MGYLVRSVVFLCCVAAVVLTDPSCVIELECAECIPDNMPVVTSHRAANGSVTAATGDEVVLACAGGKFLAYPLRDTVSAVCEGGRYRVRHDAALRHLLELGCQENVFEDVQHAVQHCGAPLQGRAYLSQEIGGRGARHLAALCWDADRAATLRTRTTSAPRNALTQPPHAERSAPLSLLGNFNHMFDAKTRADAEKLYGDDASLNRRVRQLLKHEHVSFAQQTLTAGKLLSPLYFEDQNSRVSDFVSNKVAVWSSVATGNLRALQRDVANLMRITRARAALDVHAGTRGVMSLRTGHARSELYLKAGQRFPVPRYIWSVVHDATARRAVALVLLNDPFVAVSEIRDAVFCESACSRLPWLHELRTNHNYETPLYGLVFCCTVHDFANVTDVPKELFQNVPLGNDGLLLEVFV